MAPEKVREMLRDYRGYLGRCKHLEKVISTLEHDIASAERNLISDSVSIGGQNMDGMPHGTSISNPTEQVAVRIASGYKPDYLVKMETELKEVKDEYNEKVVTVIFVDAWLKCLPERERWVIENQVIDSVSWRELVCQYPIKFGETRTKRGLQLMRDKAMERIYAFTA